MIRIQRIGLKDFRCHSELSLTPMGSAWVVLEGANGAGKTSILEAIFAAARGRSFRTRVVGDLIRTGADAAVVTVEARNGAGHRLGVAFGRQAREVRLDGRADATVADVATSIPVDYLGGEAYQLLGGPPSARRRFVDWGLFHVEPDFLGVWQAWRRAHRQRNEALRRGGLGLEAWTDLVAESGERLSRLRATYLGRLAELLADGPTEGGGGPWVAIDFRPGWRDGTLREALARSAERERRAGRAVVGPQYDDWILTLRDRAPGQLSRGQMKLASLWLVRAQAEAMARAGRNPILLVDDLLADLDHAAARRAIVALQGGAAQVWLSVLPEDRDIELPGDGTRFHVEPVAAAGRGETARDGAV